jgi:hypothetical protein
MINDIPKKQVLKAFKALGYEVTDEREHIKLANANGSKVWGLPNHKRIKHSTLSEVIRRAGIDKKQFFAEVK